MCCGLGFVKFTKILIPPLQYPASFSLLWLLTVRLVAGRATTARSNLQEFSTSTEEWIMMTRVGDVCVASVSRGPIYALGMLRLMNGLQAIHISTTVRTTLLSQSS